MPSSREVRKLLLQGREDALVELAATDARTLRPLMGRLWDPDRVMRQRAARVIGRAAAVDPDRGLELIRRLLWALNDESGTNGVHAIPALGEIGRRVPELLAPHLSALVAMCWDGGLRLELIEAFSAIADSAPQLLVGHLARLETSLDASRGDERDAFRRLCTITQKGAGHGA